jgi:hypothetical protein
MCHTNHTVHTGPGQGYHVRLTHEDYPAIQYEFYIPEVIWSHPSVQTFIQRLKSIEPGATIFQGLVGVWHVQPEETRIYRMVLRADEFDRANTRSALHSAIGQLMAHLSGSDESAQDAFMFTEADIRVTMANGLTRI